MLSYSRVIKAAHHRSRVARSALQVQMVEGHQCHRVAAAHRKLLLNQAFKATSPNGRFADGAAAIDGRPLRRIEVHGKNLFYFFSNGTDIATARLLPPAQPWPPAKVKKSAKVTKAAQKHVDIDDASEPAAPATPVAPIKSGKGRRKKEAATVEQPAALTEVLITDAEQVGQPLAENNELVLFNDPEVIVVRIHFGMSGAFRVNTMPGPDATPTTRLALTSKDLGLIAHLSAMTVEYGNVDFYRSCAAKLGPDPLREDADKEVLWQSILRSKKPVGLVLMSQEMVAGVGNIYRAEILFKAGVHPEQPASTITRDQFDKLWYHSVDLLQRGFVSGSILTVDPDEAKVLGKPWTRRYIYNQRQCGRCKTLVQSWDMAGRTVYCCSTCQPLDPSTAATQATTKAAKVDTVDLTTDQQEQPASSAEELVLISTPQPTSKRRRKVASEKTAPTPDTTTTDSTVASGLISPARRKAMSVAKPARVFRSHCAPDDVSDITDPSKLTVAELKALLLSLSMSTRGNKAELVARYAAVMPALNAAKVPATAGLNTVQDHKPASNTPTDFPGNARVTFSSADGAATEPEDDNGSGSEDELDRAEALLAAGLGTSAQAGKPATTGLSIQPGTKALVDNMATAKEAAMEKMKAGEHRGVEHVALADDDVDKLIATTTPKRKRKSSIV